MEAGFKSNNEEYSTHRRFNILGKDIFYYREVSSTNKLAQVKAINGEPAGTIVMSMFQNAGVGRLNRGWICPPGAGIMMSMILRPKLELKLIPQLTLLCGAAVADTVAELISCRAGIKWPNDVLVNGRKVCGILAQSGLVKEGKKGNKSEDMGNEEQERYVVMGLGLNVNQTVEQLPVDCRDTSSSLRIESRGLRAAERAADIETDSSPGIESRGLRAAEQAADIASSRIESGKRLSRLKALRTFIGIWDRHYDMFLRNGYPYLHDVWMERNITIGREITIKGGPEGDSYGIARDIGESGGLIVEMPTGELKEFLAEDLSLGRSFYEGRE